MLFRSVAVNCSAIPEALFESEFFGHRKGSFTGAIDSRVGLIQSAQGGSLLLDEIGDMPLTFQAKLLRALQEREVRPVGATELIAVDVRLIAASHQDLELAVRERRFREDLYYRVNVVSLEIPSLAARRDDIPRLATHFLAAIRAKLADTAVDVSGFSSEAIEMLVSAPWPGATTARRSAGTRRTRAPSCRMRSSRAPAPATSRRSSGSPESPSTTTWRIPRSSCGESCRPRPAESGNPGSAR